MDLHQFDVQVRIDLDPPNLKNYWWTYCFIVNYDDPPDTFDWRYHLTRAVAYATIDEVWKVADRVTNPPYSNENPVVTAYGGNQKGNLLVTHGYVLNTGVRMYFYAGEKLVGYKRWRQPLRTEDMVNGTHITPFILSNYNTVASVLLEAKIYGRYGDKIDNIVVDPRIHLWQWRHGTKRRARPVFAYP